MASFYDELNTLLTTYVKVPGSKLNITRLRECLQSVSTEEVYQLLTTVRNGRCTAIHIAAIRDHPEVITCLLDSVTSEQRYQLLRIQEMLGWTALHSAAYRGYTKALMCIRNSVTAEQRYQLLTIQANNGYTPLHYAAVGGYTELITHILDSVEPAQQIQLLDITDNENRTVLDEALEENNQSTADFIKQYYQRDITSAGGKNSDTFIIFYLFHYHFTYFVIILPIHSLLLLLSRD